MSYEAEIFEDNSARITYFQDAKGGLDFVEAVGKCLSQRALSITVDISTDPLQLSQILEHLQKLQQMVKAKGFHVLLAGSGLDERSPLRNKLAREGVKIIEDGGQSVNISDYLRRQSGPLPNPEKIKHFFLQVEREYNALIEERESLKAEEAFYRERIQLMKRQVGDLKAAKLLEPVVEEEQRLTAKKRALETAKKELKEVQEEYARKSRALGKQ